MECKLAPSFPRRYFQTMTNLADIKRAITTLPAEQLRELAAWLVEQLQLVGSAQSLFQKYDEEEGLCQSRVAEKSG